ncbi:MAG: hypothetical protein H6R13_2526 [Proteobacteria bacterium]|nr:hypothetical protein [Pseudomonadota bacterium]
MKSVFCTWGIRTGCAVDTAWRRIRTIFEISGAEFGYVLRGVSTADLFKANWSQIRRAEKIYCATIWQVFIVYIISFGSGAEIVYWVQGLVAEENYLKKKSRFRYFVLLCLEKAGFNFASSFIFVSEFMRDFYFRRYPSARGKRSLVIPCVSDLNASRDIQRIEDSYCYLGGMSAWQKFDVVVRIMNMVVDNNPGSTFYVATRDIQICESVLRAIASPRLLNVTSVCTLNGDEEVSRFLSGVEFGFLIRDDNLVNNVSSPIKLAEYLSCGVSVITTDALRSYADSVREAGYVIQPEVFLSSPAIDCFRYKGELAAIEVHRRLFSQSSVLAAVRGFLN